MGKSRELPDDGFESFFEESKAKQPLDHNSGGETPAKKEKPQGENPPRGTKGGAPANRGLATVATIGAIAIVILAWWNRETRIQSSLIEQSAEGAETTANDARTLAAAAETKATSAENSAQLAKLVADDAKQVATEADSAAEAAQTQASRAEIRAQELVGRLGDFTQMARISATDALETARGAQTNAQQALNAIEELRAAMPNVATVWEQQAQTAIANAATQAENAILVAREASLAAANAERQTAEVAQRAQAAEEALERMAALEEQLSAVTEKLDQIGTVENWSALDLGDHWSALEGAFPTPGFRRDWSGTTQLRGALQGAPTASSTGLLGRVPADIAPEEPTQRRVAVGAIATDGALTAATLRIEPNGDLFLELPEGLTPSWVLIDGVRFSSKR